MYRRIRILKLRNEIPFEIRSNPRAYKFARSNAFFSKFSVIFLKFSIIIIYKKARGDILHATLFIQIPRTRDPTSPRSTGFLSKNFRIPPVHTHRDRAASEWNRVFFGWFRPVKLINKADPFLAHRSLASKLRFCVGRGLWQSGTINM